MSQGAKRRALPAFEVGGSSIALRGDVSPLKILRSFPKREDEQTQSEAAM